MIFLMFLWAVAPQVTALPVIATIDHPKAVQVVVRGELPQKQARKLTDLAKTVVKDVAGRFLTDTDKTAADPIQMCLFKDDASYGRFVRAIYGPEHDFSALGFFSPAKRLVVANVGRSPGNLRHELAHALLEDDYPDIPEWLNEGVGSLYGSARRTKRGFAFLVNYRLRHFRQAQRAGELPSLVDLASSGRSQVYGPRAMVWYGFARYVLLYLESRGQLEAFWKAIREQAPTPEHQLRVLNRFVDRPKLIRWTKKLRFGRPVVPPSTKTPR